MNKFVIICSFLLSSTFVIGQIHAVTNDGDEVILNSNGTWQYVSKELQDAQKIDTNKISFTKSAGSSFLVKSSKVDIGIYINPKKWSFEKSKSNEDSEFEFTLKDKDAYGMLISEKTEIPIETLKDIALENAKNVAPDIHIVKQEYRTVNENLVFLLQMEGTLKGIKVTYIGYYFSSLSGTVQFLTYTSTNLVNQYKSDLEEFLNGIVTIQK